MTFTSFIIFNLAVLISSGTLTFFVARSAETKKQNRLNKENLLASEEEKML
jgi:hypothetical protein